MSSDLIGRELHPLPDSVGDVRRVLVTLVDLLQPPAQVIDPVGQNIDLEIRDWQPQLSLAHGSRFLRHFVTLRRRLLEPQRLPELFLDRHGGLERLGLRRDLDGGPGSASPRRRPSGRAASTRGRSLSEAPKIPWRIHEEHTHVVLSWLSVLFSLGACIHSVLPRRQPPSPTPWRAPAVRARVQR